MHRHVPASHRRITAQCASDALQGPARSLLAAMLALMFVLGAMQSARADDREAAKKACMDDYKKYCSGIYPGGGRVKKCLSDNLSKLEPACRELVSRNAGEGKASRAK